MLNSEKERVLKKIAKQWFLLSLAAATWCGYAWPEAGKFLISHGVLTIGLMLSFLLTGLTLESRVVVNAWRSIRGVTAAVISSLVVYPVAAWIFSSLFLSPELVVGFCILATAPVTISSGTILTAFARGNVSLSVFICLATNFLAVFTIPFVLQMLLGADAGVDLPVFSILGGLALKVLLPLFVGQLIKPAMGPLIGRCMPAISVFQSSLILLMVMTAVAGSADRLDDMAELLVILTAAVAVLHLFMVLFNYVLARVIRLDYRSLVAFTIHAPQKTLAVSYLVWAGYFAADFPGAFVPAIICHLLQMITGTLTAQHFRARGSTQKGARE
jgi:sodium/bile acid cotransporter 7